MGTPYCPPDCEGTGQHEGRIVGIKRLPQGDVTLEEERDKMFRVAALHK